LLLDGNKIKAVEGLERLSRLRTLWINDNRLETLTGLHNTAAAESLEALWAARNRIHTVGYALEGCSQLRELNLADNSIGHFGEIASLARLSHLKTLCLADPHFGENPLCALCNYTPLALHQLRHLDVLDTVILSDEERAAAEATFLKKRMYYNMRIRTIHRNTTNVLRKASAALSSQLQDLRTNSRFVLTSHRDVLAALAISKGIADMSESDKKRHESKLQSILTSLTSCMGDRQQAEKALRCGLEGLRSTLRSVS